MVGHSLFQLLWYLGQDISGDMDLVSLDFGFCPDFIGIKNPLPTWKTIHKSYYTLIIRHQY